MEEIYYVYYGFIAFIVSLMLGIIGMTSASWFFLILAPPLFIIGSLFAVTSLIAWYIHRNDPESKVGRDPNWVAILLGAFIIFGFYLMPVMPVNLLGLLTKSITISDYMNSCINLTPACNSSTPILLFCVFWGWGLSYIAIGLSQKRGNLSIDDNGKDVKPVESVSLVKPINQVVGYQTIFRPEPEPEKIISKIVILDKPKIKQPPRKYFVRTKQFLKLFFQKTCDFLFEKEDP
ncbi:MAG: hypothetical protein WB284_01445 [Methanoregula sp.]|uniref:hypothetical protein n=1 Tax=Methanoregula sp. TaxID=2052170 RepID=UPI003C384270